MEKCRSRSRNFSTLPIKERRMLLNYSHMSCQSGVKVSSGSLQSLDTCLSPTYLRNVRMSSAKWKLVRELVTDTGSSWCPSPRKYLYKELLECLDGVSTESLQDPNSPKPIAKKKKVAYSEQGLSSVKEKLE